MPTDIEYAAGNGTDVYGIGTTIYGFPGVTASAGSLGLARGYGLAHDIAGWYARPQTVPVHPNLGNTLWNEEGAAALPVTNVYGFGPDSYGEGTTEYGFPG